MSAPLTFEALGTRWWIEIFEEIDDKRRDGLYESVTSLVRSIEVRFSRFLPNSLITDLNTKRTITTSDTDIFSLIALGQEFYSMTDGVFNCLLAEHLEAKGYDATYSFKPTTAPAIFSNPLTDIFIKDDTITLAQGKLDLGGYGKGWAIDKVALLLRREGLSEFLINAGGDMYGTTEHGKPIIIYLEHPLIQGIYIGTTTLLHQGFAASSPHKRQWKHAGKTYTHIIDTVQNEEKIPNVIKDAVFVKAKEAVVADAFATTGLLLTPDTLLEIAFNHQIGLALFNHTENSLFSNQAFINKGNEVS